MPFLQMEAGQKRKGTHKEALLRSVQLTESDIAKAEGPCEAVTLINSPEASLRTSLHVQRCS